MKGLVVAGTRSGCGKTSLALGLMAALGRRGLRVAPFKCGPDFIDPAHHERACGRASHNLDGWMCGRSGVEEIFARHAQDADVAVVEGVMGLFDGFSGRDEAGSSAQVAKWLGLPVLLAADASSMARSAAAMVGGYLAFDPALPFVGVVLNRVASHNHAELLREACADLPAPLLGLLPREEGLALPARHLGLVLPGADHGAEGAEDAVRGRLADWVERSLDLDALLERLPDVSPAAPVRDAARPAAPRARIAVARDAAFRFYYHENLRLLEAAGAELLPFSPIADKRLPEGADGLYLGGGYPELYAYDLSNNAGLRREIRRFCEDDRPVYAECGGFMYLMDSMVDVNGLTCRMAGVFPFAARMNERFAGLGYRQVTTAADSLLGPAGTLARGHEFHYSSIPDEAYAQAGLYAVEDRKGPRERPDGFAAHTVAASYIHLHFGSNPLLARHFADACAAGRAGAAAAQTAEP
ncbi:Cobyrinic acid A,C-diamide synthase [Desulfovibrio sp. X2]|uniref:cobyrinate a,c-diamide synthase n=1 Tax=Desulfovibrio sp. X2 TaxID=941449 RepID=UPI000358EB90|nr:cobyrinate a,c-diamide synthase [Desulfovibrio sp. X2]EPR42118.1 Cobyrinic acid A,C-diamide synthase [Desulfovibrio sp. X2]